MKTIIGIATVICAASAAYIAPGGHPDVFTKNFGGPIAYSGGPIGGYPIHKFTGYHTPSSAVSHKKVIGLNSHLAGASPFAGYQPAFKTDLKVLNAYQPSVHQGYQAPVKVGVKYTAAAYEVPAFAGYKAAYKPAVDAYQAPVFTGYQAAVKTSPFGYAGEGFGPKSFGQFAGHKTFGYSAADGFGQKSFGYSPEGFGHKNLYGGYAAPGVVGLDYWKQKKAA